jgi:hypothetical protein
VLDQCIRPGCVLLEQAATPSVEDRRAAAHSEAPCVPCLGQRCIARPEAVLAIQRQRAQHGGRLLGDGKGGARGRETSQREREQRLGSRRLPKGEGVPGPERQRAPRQIGHSAPALGRGQIDQPRVALQPVEQGVQLRQQRRQLGGRPGLDLGGHARASRVHQPLGQDAEQIRTVLGHRKAQSATQLPGVCIQQRDECWRQVPSQWPILVIAHHPEHAGFSKHRQPIRGVQGARLMRRHFPPSG